MQISYSLNCTSFIDSRMKVLNHEITEAHPWLRCAIIMKNFPGLNDLQGPPTKGHLGSSLLLLLSNMSAQFGQ